MKQKIVLLLFMAFISGCAEKKPPVYDNLADAIATEYGPGCEIVEGPPIEYATYRLVGTGMFFVPNTEVKGTVTAQLDDGGYGFPFSYEANPDNYTIVQPMHCVSERGFGGVCKVVLKSKKSPEKVPTSINVASVPVKKEDETK